jgi:hypothetical protein
MKGNPKSNLRTWNPFKDPAASGLPGEHGYGTGEKAAPLGWGTRGRDVAVLVKPDLFTEGVPFEFVDWAFAVMASSSRVRFYVLTKWRERALAYYFRVTEKGAGAQRRYYREALIHKAENIHEWAESLSATPPPTRELRFIYDQAVAWENRGGGKRNPKPNGHGFSGGEYHWRAWPLSNVRIYGAEDINLVKELEARPDLIEPEETWSTRYPREETERDAKESADGPVGPDGPPDRHGPAV